MIKEFTVSTKHTINLGNYESMSVEASVTYSVNGDYEAARGEAQKVLEQLLSDSFYKQKSPPWFVHIAGKKGRTIPGEQKER